MKVNNHPNTLALMIDIETLALSTRAHVTQVGYCMADVDTGQYLVEARDVWLPTSQPGREIDVGTVRWWTKQNEDVTATVFDCDDGRRTPPKELFALFAELCKHWNPTVWASPAMFDLAVLTDLFGGRKPWLYNVERDMMSLYKQLDPTGKLQPPENDKGHLASADAKWQMDYLFHLRTRMRLLHNGDPIPL